MIIVIIFSIILALVVTSLVAIIIVVCTKRKHTNRKGSVAIHAPNTDLHLENGLDGRGIPMWDDFLIVDYNYVVNCLFPVPTGPGYYSQWSYTVVSTMIMSLV